MDSQRPTNEGGDDGGARYVEAARRAILVFHRVIRNSITPRQACTELEPDLDVLKGAAPGSDFVEGVALFCRLHALIAGDVGNRVQDAQSQESLDFAAMLTDFKVVIDGEAFGLVADEIVFSIDDSDLSLPELPVGWPFPIPVHAKQLTIAVSKSNAVNARRFCEDSRRLSIFVKRRMSVFAGSEAMHRMLVEVRHSIETIIEDLLRLDANEGVSLLRWLSTVLEDARQRNEFPAENVANAVLDVFETVAEWEQQITTGYSAFQESGDFGIDTSDLYWLSTYGKDFGIQLSEVDAARQKAQAKETDVLAQPPSIRIDGLTAIGSVMVPEDSYRILMPELSRLAVELSDSMPLLRAGTQSAGDWLWIPHAIASTAASLRIRRLMDAADAMEFWASIEAASGLDMPTPPPPALEELVAYVLDSIGRIANLQEPVDPQWLIDGLGFKDTSGVLPFGGRSVALEDEIRDVLLQMDAAVAVSDLRSLKNLLRSLIRSVSSIGLFDFKDGLNDLDRALRHCNKLLPEHYADFRSITMGIGHILSQRDAERGTWGGKLRQVDVRDLSSVAFSAKEVADRIDGVVEFMSSVVATIRSEQSSGLADLSPARVQELIELMEVSVSELHSVGGKSQRLMVEAKRLQEIAFAQISGRLVKAVDMACRAHGRLAYVEITKTVPLPADELEQIAMPLERLVEYLVQNSIEPAVVRSGRGKPHVARIEVRARVADKTLFVDVVGDGDALLPTMIDSCPMMMEIRSLAGLAKGVVDLAPPYGFTLKFPSNAK